jgi:endonuclease YncB( thermonuclease family)
MLKQMEIKTSSTARLLRIAILLVQLLTTTAQAEILSGLIVSIADGDTLMLADTSKQVQTIRLLGIDAPEITQDFGRKAKTALSALAFNQQAIADCKIENRIKLCVVVVGAHDIGLEQIRNGMAWWYKQHSAQQSAKERADYEQAEFTAKIHRLGLWNSKNPAPPWDWRHGRPDE